MSETHSEWSEIVTSLARRSAALDLKTIDLCFAASLHARAKHAALASFSEEQLFDVFEFVCDLVAPAGESRPRAADAIRRLREQRMLARVDGSGVMRAGEYSLTRLAAGIVEFFVEQETLTKDNLALLTRTLSASLADLRRAAEAAVATGDWQTSVVAPLRVTVADLISGIQRRQRGFDLQQEEVQKQIAALLQADWFGALERCQSLLESTSTTLRELNQVLLRDTPRIQTALHELAELAADADAETERATGDVMDQVDRIGSWGSARQRAFSDYYQYVHRFLRDVVRLDPSRVLTHRLRERLAGRAGPAYTLVVADSPPLRLLREASSAVPQSAPVRRRRSEREAPLANEAIDDPRVKLEADVRAALLAGATGLSQVTAKLTGELPPEERFVAAGRIAHAIAGVCHPGATADRPWVSVEGELFIEEWSVPAPK